MYTKEIDILNVILIVLSLTLAFNIPFQLVIYSYAFLGPLHYLTEINWLNEKKYFIQNTRLIWVFIFFATIISIPILISLPYFTSLLEENSIKKISNTIFNYSDEMILISLLLAIGFIYIKNKIHLILFLLVSAIISIVALHFLPTIAIAITIFIPTVVHIYFFTLFFMIYGTINSKSTPGIVAIIALILVPFIILLSKIDAKDYYTISDFARESYNASTFTNLSYWISKVFSDNSISEFNFLSAMGIKIQIFIAFAYTYHYLNWFSKTSIIKWNKGVSNQKMITIIVVWLLSCILYIYNFKVGFIALSLLSLIHVFLEFPLNIVSIKGILSKITSTFLVRQN